MQRQMSFRQYRAMDIGFFTAMLCVCEMLIVFAGTFWFPGELYTLSLTPAVCAIVMARWGAWAAVPAVCGALAFCFASGAQPMQYVVYGAGNLLALVLWLWLRRATWRRLKENVLAAMVYGWMTALLMQLGRAVVALLLGAPVGAMAAFVSTDVLSAFFAALVVCICRRLDGVLEEQKHYILRIQEEENNRAGGVD